MKKGFLLFFVILASKQFASAQFIQAYEDSRKYFYVFQDGVSNQLESQPVRSFSMSAEAVVYVDNGNNLKAWYHGEKFSLGEGNNLQFNSSKNFITDRKSVV